MIVNKYSGNNGGGGGSYTLPVATSSRLGGVKVGTGLSIDASGVLSSEGGSGGYNVVDSLPATGSATEGALYYLKPYVESVEYRGISITTTASEDYAAHIYDGNGNEKPVYISGTDFHWGYQNDGEYHKKDDADYWYKTDNANKTINIYLPDDSWTVTLEENATSAETSPYTVQVPHDAQTYRFNGTGYTIAEGYDDIYLYFDYNDKDNSEKRQALAGSISSVKAENRKNIKLFVSNLSSEYIKSLEGDPYIQFIPAFISEGSMVFTASILPFNGGGNLEDPVFINCHVDFNGGLNFQMVQAPSLFVFNVDPVSHALDSNGQSWYDISCTLGDSGKRNGPIIQLVYNGRIFNAVYKGTSLSHNYRGGIYLDAKHEGKNLHGVWNVGYNNCTLIEWSENPDSYQSVSELSNAGIDTASFLNGIYSVPANVITSLTGETELFVNTVYDYKCRVTTDGNAIKMYGEDGAGGWVLRGSGTWADSSIGTTDIGCNPNISYITTGSTTYQFTFVYGDYGDPGVTISKTPFYQPFEELLAYDQSNSTLNLYAGGQWRTVYPPAYQSVSKLSDAGMESASFVSDKYSVPTNVITSLTEETELFIKSYNGTKCKVTTDGTNIHMYGSDGGDGWVERGSGTWTDSSIEATGITYNPQISGITTGNTTYEFKFYFSDNMNAGEVVSKTPFYQPFEGLLAFDKSNTSLNLYAGGQWRTVYPQA